MKLKAGRKYEACIAKTTLPKDWDSCYLAVDTWYPIANWDMSFIYVDLGPKFGSPLVTVQKNAVALGAEEGRPGGNWKIREVKEKKCSM